MDNKTFAKVFGDFCWSQDNCGWCDMNELCHSNKSTNQKLKEIVLERWMDDTNYVLEDTNFSRIKEKINKMSIDKMASMLENMCYGMEDCGCCPLLSKCAEDIKYTGADKWKKWLEKKE